MIRVASSRCGQGSHRNIYKERLYDITSCGAEGSALLLGKINGFNGIENDKETGGSEREARERSLQRIILCFAFVFIDLHHIL